MLENVLFFYWYRILKIAMSAIVALSLFIRLQRLLYFWLKLHFIIQQFLLVRVQGLAMSPGAGYPRYASDTHTTGFLKVCTSLANQALPALPWYGKYTWKKLSLKFPLFYAMT